MKLFLKILLFVLFYITVVPAGPVEAQTRSMRKIEHTARRDARKRSPKVIKAEKKAAKIKARQQAAYEKAKKEDNKRRLDMQTPETRERMAQNRKNADQQNKHDRTPFLKRLFRPKK